MKRIVLVNPNIYDFAAYDFWLKPLGLLYVGAFLKRAGFDVKLIDLLNRHDPDLKKYVKIPKDKYYSTGKFPSQIVEKPPILKNIPRNFKLYGAPPEFLIKKLKEIKNVDAVFVTSTMTYWYYGVWETVKIIKRVVDAPVVLGGIYTQILPHHAKRSPADFVFPYNDLNLLIAFLKKWFGWEVKGVDGDWFEELDPEYSLYKNVGYLVFTASIGCPFRCSYCITPKMWKFRKKSPEKVVKAIEKYVDIFEVKDVSFFDDAFLVDKKRTSNLLKLIINTGLSRKLRFHLPNGIHARLVDEEIAYLLKDANFKTIKLGYETSGELQKKTGGKVFDSDLERAVFYLKNAGFTYKEVSAYVLVNLPGQKVKDAIDAIDFVISLGIDVNVNEYTPIPGTDEWMNLVENKIIDPDVDPLLLNNTILPLWWGGGMSADEVEFVKSYAREKKKRLNETIE